MRKASRGPGLSGKSHAEKQEGQNKKPKVCSNRDSPFKDAHNEAFLKAQRRFIVRVVLRFTIIHMETSQCGRLGWMICHAINIPSWESCSSSPFCRIRFQTVS